MFVSSVGVNKANNSKATKIGSAAGIGAGALYRLRAAFVAYRPHSQRNVPHGRAVIFKVLSKELTYGKYDL